METFEVIEEPKQPKRRRFGGCIWNVLTALVLLSALCIAGWFLLIFTNPYTALNPFPPFTPEPTIFIPSATPTPLGVLPPTWTASPSPEPSATYTPRPTATIPPSATPLGQTPDNTIPLETNTPEAEEPEPGEGTPVGGFPFQVNGRPLAIQNIAYPEQGCNWMGVAGQVLDLNGAPVQGQIVRLGGALPGESEPFEPRLTLTGLPQQFGPGHYLFEISDRPVASQERLWLQLLSQEGAPISDRIYFETFDSCEAALIVINFRQVR